MQLLRVARRRALQEVDSAVLEDCVTGRCAAHDRCPADSFCCVSALNGNCRPPPRPALPYNDTAYYNGTNGTNRTNATASWAASNSRFPGWRLVFRQQLTFLTDGPEVDVRGDWPASAAVRLNAHNPSADLYSVLDELEAHRQDDGLFEFKLVYPKTNAGGDAGSSPRATALLRRRTPVLSHHWAQSAHPARHSVSLQAQFERRGDVLPSGAQVLLEWHKVRIPCAAVTAQLPPRTAAP